MLDSVRDIEGFPIGKDEDILELSDPPYYTACPNPYIKDFIEEHGKPFDEATDIYHREPFIADISEGKNDPIYNLHSYHTKVPHLAIMKYIEHYTDEGDIVFDGFCGSGMAGIAAQMLNRKSVLLELSPFATFISGKYNNPSDPKIFEKRILEALAEAEEIYLWVYETYHRNDISKKGIIEYTIWSDILKCPYCGSEYIYYDTAVNTSGEIEPEYKCKSCDATISKNVSEKVLEKIFDDALGIHIIQQKQVPVLINYKYNNKRYSKKPDANDLDIIKRITDTKIPYWFPSDKMLFRDGYWGDQFRAGYHFGITHVHHFFLKRSLLILSFLSEQLIDEFKFFFTTLLVNSSKMSRFGKRTGNVSGTLYIPKLIKELNIFEYSKRKLTGPKGYVKPLINLQKIKNNLSFISTQSACDLKNINSNIIDYIFVDPPFGDNLHYSELNFIQEAWLKVFTNNKDEAIINNTQGKRLNDYSNLLNQSFTEFYRLLKPNRWITVEFHNSKSAVWNAIQNAILKAGFIIAYVSVLDKKQGSFKQVTSAGSVKNDLVISAYKPRQHFEQKFLELAGEGLEQDFIEMHLLHLPSEPSIERTEQMLYSKLLAFYVQRSYTVRYDASIFYKMLRKNFTEKDSYWFNQDQIEAYHEYKLKMKLDCIDDIRKGQMSMFVSDEKSALIWLHTFLDEPKDFKTIHPSFTKVANISGDQTPDLRELLEDNFILEGDKYRRPQSDEEKLNVMQKRERELLREFEALLLEAKGSKKKIKECRKQAVIFGFEHCYKKERFQDILTLAKRLDSKIIETDSELNEFIEVAELKVEGF